MVKTNCPPPPPPTVHFELLAVIISRDINKRYFFKLLTLPKMYSLKLICQEGHIALVSIAEKIICRRFDAGSLSNYGTKFSQTKIGEA